MTDTYVTTTHAARIIGVTPAAIRQWADQGKLPVAVQSESGVRFYLRRDAERIARERTQRQTRTTP